MHANGEAGGGGLVDEFDVDAELQQALDRLALLAEVTKALGSTLDADEGLRRVCRIVVPQLADWCAMDLLEGGEQLRRVCVTHRDPALLHGLLESCLPVPDEATGPLARVLRGAGPLLLRHSELPVEQNGSTRGWDLLKELDVDSAVIAPLRARRRVMGAITLARTTRERPFGEEDLGLAEELSHRIALQADNARLYRAVQATAEHLQRALLPELPRVDGLELVARYSPARAEAAEVGGDWYDSFVLPTGDTTLIIGDVTGHDMRAAVAMGQLRNMLRGIACDRQEPPDAILRRLDIAQQVVGRTTATCFYSVIHGARGGPWELAYSSAGHLPPLLVTHEGDTGYLEGGAGLMIGVDPDHSRTMATEPLPARSTLLLYTDGLIERRDESLESGLTRLRQHAAALAREPLPAMCDELLAGLLADPYPDDVALLALRLPLAGTPGSEGAARLSQEQTGSEAVTVPMD
ncbi:GAF domain-containing SpoIIE family protein phosphatase [Streptomyces sp. NPDC005708]|uniref:PP2C family protein-serine/threonine phosphatase n=1 Tax=unclassified Streptomyces TaxID=2593676 RepID=UPI00340652AA